MARFKLLGNEIKGQEQNTTALDLHQQHVMQREVVVYETDDFSEVQTIIQSGGFFRNRDDFVAVTRVVDSDADPVAVDPVIPFPQKGN
jgi:hypothetical protein